MEIWKVHCCIGILLNVRLLLLWPSSDLLDIRLDLTWILFPISVILAFSIAATVFTIRVAAVSAIAILLCHPLWLLIGSSCLSRSIHTSREELQNGNFFEDERHTWKDLGNTPGQRGQQVSHDEHQSPAILVNSRREDIYSTLDEKKGHIRLLSPVYNEAEIDHLQFELFHSALSDDWKNFAALSYCWGNDEPSKAIVIWTSRRSRSAGTTVLIRSNLYDA